MPADRTVDFVVAFVVIGMVAAGLSSMAIGWIVNRYREMSGRAMSSAENVPAPMPLSSKDGQDDGRTDGNPIGRAELLTLYTVLRKYGVPREEIRPVLKGVRVPLSNDVWASAAPPPPVHVTPVAGRPTDADFPYQPLDA